MTPNDLRKTYEAGNKSRKPSLLISKLYYEEFGHGDIAEEKDSDESEDKNRSQTDDEFWESTDKWLGLGEQESLKILSHSCLHHSHVNRSSCQSRIASEVVSQTSRLQSKFGEKEIG
jgi:hypothetical protein